MEKINEESSEKNKIMETYNKMRAHLKENQIVKKTKNKDIILILGDKGSGKSTLINYLLKSKLIKKIQKGQFYKIIDLAEGETKHCEISHSIDSSKTKGISMHESKDGNLVFLKTQVFFHSRGMDYQIAFSLLLSKILENCRSLKFIFTVDYNLFLVNRMVWVKKFFDYIQNLFDNQYFFRECKNSVMVLITKHHETISLKYFLERFSETENQT